MTTTQLIQMIQTTITEYVQAICPECDFDMTEVFAECDDCGEPVGDDGVCYVSPGEQMDSIIYVHAGCEDAIN